MKSPRPRKPVRVRHSRATVTPPMIDTVGEVRPDGLVCPTIRDARIPSGAHMSQASIAATSRGRDPLDPVAQLAPWAAFVFLAAAIVLFFISADQGIISIPGWQRRPRVGPRRTPPARLPLPLIDPSPGAGADDSVRPRRATRTDTLMTPRNFLVRGLLAGLIAGLFTFAVAYTVGEPQVDAAIAVEEAAAAHAAEHAENPPADGHTHEDPAPRCRARTSPPGASPPAPSPSASPWAAWSDSPRPSPPAGSDDCGRASPPLSSR